MPDKNRRQQTYRRYSITEKEYKWLYLYQDGRCAICKEPARKKNLCVDHDHKCCGALKSCGLCVRGLLCGLCNTWLGITENNPRTLNNVGGQIRAYLKQRGIATIRMAITEDCDEYLNIERYLCERGLKKQSRLYMKSQAKLAATDHQVKHSGMPRLTWY